MKKLLVLFVFILFTSVCSFSQSPSVEVRMARINTIKPVKVKNTTIQKDSLERAILKQVEQARRDAIKKDIEKKRRAAIRRQWLRAIFLGGKFPGESDEAYRKRLEVQSYPASQPFK